MEVPTKVDDRKQLTHPDLIDLYKHYWSVLHAELGFCHQYLNFYSGLLSALLAATLAGLLSLKFRGFDELALLLGPLLIGVFAFNGYQTVKVFYIRFVEAWVTTLNLESMLGIRYSHQPNQPRSDKPRYVSRYKSFIPTIEDRRIREILEGIEPGKKGGAAQAKTAEQVMEELSKARWGTTLFQAKLTFIIFGGAALLLVAFIVLTVIYPNLSQQWLPGQ
jgi:hypothetical protein